MLNVSAICCILILFDVVSGVLNAVKNGELSSSIMRKGLFNKVAELILLGLAIFLGYAITIPPFDNMGVPPEILMCVSGYIGLMEILSILENISKINPDLPFAKLLLIFNLPVDSAGNDMVESEQAPGK